MKNNNYKKNNKLIEKEEEQMDEIEHSNPNNSNIEGVGENEENTVNNKNQGEEQDENYVYEICQLFDKDNNETIYLKDLLDLIKALGIGLNEETRPIIDDFIEKSNDEKISFDDFFQLYDLLNQYKKPKEEEMNELLKAFEFFDEGSGFIDINYFKKAITCFGNKISEEDFMNIMERVITDNTGKKFDYKDLSKIILEMKK